MKMNDQNVRNQITRAIDEANWDLNGCPFLAEKIMEENTSQTHTLSRKKLIPMISLALLLIVVTAFALMNRQSAVGAYGFWSYEDGRLMFQGENDQTSRIVLEDDRILAMDAETKSDTLYYITQDTEGMQLLSITPGGYAATPGRRINSKYNIQELRVSEMANGYILADTSTGSGQLYQIAGMDESLTPDMPLVTDGWQNQGITTFAIDQDTVYAYRGETGDLAVFTAYDRKLKHSPVTVHGITCLEAGYQENGVDYAFALSDQSPAQLLLINTKTGEKMDTGERTAMAGCRLDRDQHTLYVISDSEKRVVSFRISQLSGKKTLHDLTIVNGDILEDACLQAAIRMFNEKYPDVEVFLRYVDDDRIIATELMAGETGIDLFMYRSNAEYITGEMLFRNGAIRDLSAIPEILAVLPEYRNIWNPVSAGGKIYGLPINQNISLWKVNQELAERIGWELPRGCWTIEEFEQLMDRVIEWNETHEDQIILLCGETEYLMSQYESTHIDIYAGTVNLRTDEYIHLLELQKKMADHHLLLSRRDLRPDQSIKESIIPQNALIRSGLYRIDEENIILPPVPDPAESNPWLATGWCMYVNANSPWPEETAYMMTCLFSPDVMSRRSYRDNGQWLKDKSRYGEEDPALTMMEGELNPETEALYNDALEHLTRSKRINMLADLPYADWVDLLESMLMGQISPEEYARIMQGKTEMTLGE